MTDLKDIQPQPKKELKTEKSLSIELIKRTETNDMENYRRASVRNIEHCKNLLQMSRDQLNK